jgi:hypothetical protein
MGVHPQEIYDDCNLSWCYREYSPTPLGHNGPDRCGRSEILFSGKNIINLNSRGYWAHEARGTYSHGSGSFHYYSACFFSYVLLDEA